MFPAVLFFSLVETGLAIYCLFRYFSGFVVAFDFGSYPDILNFVVALSVKATRCYIELLQFEIPRLLPKDLPFLLEYINLRELDQFKGIGSI